MTHNDALSIAESVLLAPANLHTPQLASLLNGKLTGQADYADMYFQHSRHEAWVLEDGIVRDASFNTERGAGVRIVQGEKTGFAYSDDITLDALQQASGAARAITRHGQDRQIQLASRAVPARYAAIDPLLGERGSAGGGGRVAYDWLLQEERIETWAREAVRGALLNLEAEAAPAGTMPVVLGPGWPGVLLHEAVGHGLEGDFNRKGTSMFAKKFGQQVASPLCTVVDDGTLPDRRGSLTIDDEGTPTACNTLIENGKLVGFMQDKTNARLMGVAPTGNGRRESYAHLPMPRMTNTYMLPGESDPQDIVASLDRGIYAVNFGGGQVDITSGRFVFSTSEAYLVEKGKIVCPVKGATLIGSGAEVMSRISMVGNDLALDSGIGVCGKDGQSVPVGVGQPTLRVDALTVGGTA